MIQINAIHILIFGLACVVAAVAALVAAATWHIQECREWLEGMSERSGRGKVLLDHARYSRIGFLMPFLLRKRKPLSERFKEPS